MVAIHFYSNMPYALPSINAVQCSGEIEQHVKLTA